ncbi:ABC transporter permease [Rhodobacter lacus]|uniref:ABC transporter permease n=1 Tax=Rhodobacter lacus TaxID=1641972 RepID=A0ABW5A8V3_9RHOB
MSDTSLTQPAAPRTGKWHDVWIQFRHHKGAMSGMVVLGLIVITVVLGPLLWHIDPTEIAMRARNKGPSLAHPFGTDQLGRDLFARLIAGGRVSLTVGVTAMLLSLSLGTLIGVCAGYFRRLDGPLMRLTDMFLALPLLPLLLVMSMLFRETLARSLGPETGIFLLIVLAIGLTSWMHTARLVRGEVLTLKEREFILAARSSGTRDGKMILRHVLPNVLSPVLVSATLGIASAIITESSLSFLGLGFPPDFPTWGRLLFDAIDQIQLYPIRVILPGVAISLTVLSVNYVGDGLRDAMDPRLRGR